MDQLRDGLVVEGRVQDNLRWARMALESGRPVMLEKPAGTDLEEFRQLIELAKRQGLHLQMIYLFRYMSAVLRMLQLAREGALGQIYEFRARIPKELRLYEHNEENFAWHPGGIFFEMAGQMIDMMVAILGRPRAIQPMLAHHHESPGTFVDNGVAIFQYERVIGIA